MQEVCLYRMSDVYDVLDIIVTSKQEIEASVFVKKIVRYYFPIAVISKEKSFNPCKSKRFNRKFNVNHL